MSSLEAITYFIILCLMTIVFGYLLGLSVIRVVDHRLSEISIKIPKIVVQDSNSKISQNNVQQLKPLHLYESFDGNVNDNGNGNGSGSGNAGVQKKQIQSPLISPLQQELPPINTTNQKTDHQIKPYIVGCQSDQDCNIVYGQGQNKCLVNNQCYCLNGSGIFCHYGPTYYKDPKDMTPEQLQKFKTKAKFDHMTVQDYVNWLYLHNNESDLENLTLRHLINLRKLLKGIPLTLNDIPRDIDPRPLTAQEYFDRLYLMDDSMLPRNTDTAGLQIPANYVNYPQFYPPKNLKHLNDPENDILDEKINKYLNRDVLDKMKWVSTRTPTGIR